MPSVIDPETMNVDELPGVWSPVQWELSADEKARELEAQAAASLLQAVNAPEALLRLLLNETGIDRAFESPPGYDPDLQGEWDHSLVTFQFKRPMRLERVVRDGDYLYVEYNCGDVGYWSLEIEPERVTIQRV